MSQILIKKLPNLFKDSFPINVSFVKGIDISPLKNEQLKFVNSDFYNTKKWHVIVFINPHF